MLFKNFNNNVEEEIASGLISKIDKGEKWIFEGAKGSDDFGGFLNRLYYNDNETQGVYCSCIYNQQLRVQIAFDNAVPIKLQDEIHSLILKDRNRLNTFTSIWYRPENNEIHNLLFNKLPWPAKGHKTHELTFKRKKEYSIVNHPPNIFIIPFSKVYINDCCRLLDISLSHTFNNCHDEPFKNNLKSNLADWEEKSKTGQCCIMLLDQKIVGMYILDQSEIKSLAIDVNYQKKGFGKLLLYHARENIFSNFEKEPFLYCIDSNINALGFYLREGMIITGHSGYVYFNKKE